MKFKDHVSIPRSDPIITGNSCQNLSAANGLHFSNKVLIRAMLTGHLGAVKASDTIPQV